MSSLASIPLLLITEDKGGPIPGHKTKIQFCSVEAGTSSFTIFGKDSEEVEEIYRAQTETPIILLYELWATQHSQVLVSIYTTKVYNHNVQMPKIIALLQLAKPQLS